MYFLRYTQIRKSILELLILIFGFRSKGCQLYVGTSTSVLARFRTKNSAVHEHFDQFSDQSYYQEDQGLHMGH